MWQIRIDLKKKMCNGEVLNRGVSSEENLGRAARQGLRGTESAVCLQLHSHLCVFLFTWLHLS